MHRATCKAGVIIRVSGNNIILSPSPIATGLHVARVLSALAKGLAAI